MDKLLTEIFMQNRMNEVLRKVIRVMEHDYNETISVKCSYIIENDSYEIELYENPYSENSHILVKVKLEEVYTYCEVTCKDGYYITDLKFKSEMESSR